MTVTKAGSADTNARVNVVSSAVGVYLYGTTDGSGQVTFTIPVTSTAQSFTVSANDQGATSGSSTFSWSTSTTSPIAAGVTLS